MAITVDETLLRLGASIVLGAAVGYERERAGRPAGLRTHLLVCLASTTFMLVSTQFLYFQHYGKDDLVTTDPSRIAASVVAGVGFLGAGAILRTGLGVQGLTTAASLWMMASVGLAAGGGMYLVAVASTAAALVCLIFLRKLEGQHWRVLQRRVIVTMSDDPAHRTALLDRLTRAGAEVTDVDLDRNLKAKRTRLTVDVRLPDRAALERLLAEAGTVPGVRRVKVQRPG